MTYLERKLAGLCTQTGCTQPAAEGAQLCARHLRRRRRVDLRYRRRLRRARREAGLCAFCGVRSATYRCRLCLIRGGFVSADSVRTSVDKQRTIDDDGRRRYHGQGRRGQQPRAQLDRQDLDSALTALTKARAGLALAESPEYADAPRSQREDARATALSYADLSSRFVEDVLERNRKARQR